MVTCAARQTPRGARSNREASTGLPARSSFAFETQISNLKSQILRFHELLRPPGRSLDPIGNGRARGMIAALVDLRFGSQMSNMIISDLAFEISVLRSTGEQNSAYRFALFAMRTSLR